MNEEKPKYKKKKILNPEEMLKHINTDFQTIKLSDLGADEQFIAKIDGELNEIKIEKEAPDGEIEERTLYSIPVIYDVNGSDYKMSVRIGESCAKRFKEKYKDTETVGKSAFFTKSIFRIPDGTLTYPQHVAVFTPKKREKQDFEELLKGKEKEGGFVMSEAEETYVNLTKQWGIEGEEYKRQFIKTYVERNGAEERANELWNNTMGK